MWLADGTFKVVPNVFFQLYTIHFAFGNGVCPAAIYCLLSDKSAATYERLHREVKNLIPTAAPRSILVDFEKAAMNTFSAAYTTATLRSCYILLGGTSWQDLQQQKARLMQGVAGLEHSRKKKYRILNAPVQRTVCAYGQSDVLLYLRAIAHLSHV